MLNPTVPPGSKFYTTICSVRSSSYETILGVDLRRERMGATDLAVFPYGGQPLSAAPCSSIRRMQPQRAGSIVYLGVSDLRPVLARRAARRR